MLVFSKTSSGSNAHQTWSTLPQELAERGAKHSSHREGARIACGSNASEFLITYTERVAWSICDSNNNNIIQ